ncbi:unnamed protein product [Ambrosiozyma monospora]|uniref:Unnamed protein product n=1 Tax=Ambrosiozyma monospora TaxID=43982 RepID=A0ACB5T4X6_AMBMO|nr:unnamed protein product [Ambrosiozyma monospora]
MEPEIKTQVSPETRTPVNPENRIPSTRTVTSLETTPAKWKSAVPPTLPFPRNQSSGLPFGNNGLNGQQLPLPNCNQHLSYPPHSLPPLPLNPSMNPSLNPPPPPPQAFQYPPITNPTDPLTVNNVNSIGKNHPIAGYPGPISNFSNNFQTAHFNNNNMNNSNFNNNNNMNNNGNASIGSNRKLLSISELTAESPSPGSTPTSLLNGIPHILSSSSTTMDSSNNLGTNVMNSASGIPSIQSEVRKWAPQQFPSNKNQMMSNESHGSITTTPGINSISPSSELSTGNSINSMNGNNGNNGGNRSRLPPANYERVHPPLRYNYDHTPYFGNE